MAPTGDIPTLLTVREFAEAVRISEQTIRRRVNDGTLQAVKLGALMRIPTSELERLLGEPAAGEAFRVDIDGAS
jgi:excisionase family DNA binding protein